MHLKSEHIVCRIIKTLLQTLHNIFLYQLLLQDTGKQHSSLDKKHGTFYQLSPVSTGVFNTNAETLTQAFGATSRAGLSPSVWGSTASLQAEAKAHKPELCPGAAGPISPAEAATSPDISTSLCSERAGDGPRPDLS